VVRHLVAIGFALGIARDPGCGDVDSPRGAVNAPCTRDKDCQGDQGLVCREGVCADADAGASDAGNAQAKDVADERP